jgi:hypothetical protein
MPSVDDKNRTACGADAPDRFSEEPPSILPLRVDEWSDGFRVSSGGVSIRGQLKEWAIVLSWPGMSGCAPYSLFETHGLTSFILGWLQSPRREVPLAEPDDPDFSAVWQLVRRQRRRLLRRFPSEVVAVQRAIVAATGSPDFDGFSHSAPLYERRYVIRDVLRYPAAAVAVKLARRLFEQLQERLGLSTQRVDVEVILDALSNWRGLFSPSGISYRSLDRTLMNLPTGWVGDIAALQHLPLTRPIETSLELEALAGRVDYWHRLGDPAKDNHVQLLHRAGPQGIERAIARIGRIVGRWLDPQCTLDIEFAMEFLAEFRELHAGLLDGLVSKAIRWHQRRRRSDLQQSNALPPIPLPIVNGVRFLVNASEVVDEGVRMGHCIGSYADRAASGQSFLFHVEHGGEEATVEVSDDGQIAAAGPFNCLNGAATWGCARLGAWAAAWPRASAVLGLEKETGELGEILGNSSSPW